MSALATDTSGLVGAAAGVPVTVANPAPPMTCFVMQVDVTAHGTGTITTPSFHTAAAGEILLAFVSASGPAGANKQAATISGAGLKWTLVQRENAHAGGSEVWMASADHVLVNASVRSSLSVPGYPQALTVIAMEGVSGVGASVGASGGHGTPSLDLTTTGDTSLVFAVGNDGALPADPTPAGSLPDGWVPLHQWVDRVQGGSHWTQYTNDPTGPAGSVVRPGYRSPGERAWNLVAVELLNDDS
jgi:hypothetical protein